MAMYREKSLAQFFEKHGAFVEALRQIHGAAWLLRQILSCSSTLLEKIKSVVNSEIKEIKSKCCTSFTIVTNTQCKRSFEVNHGKCGISCGSMSCS